MCDSKIYEAIQSDIYMLLSIQPQLKLIKEQLDTKVAELSDKIGHEKLSVVGKLMKHDYTDTSTQNVLKYKGLIEYAESIDRIGRDQQNFVDKLENSLNEQQKLRDHLKSELLAVGITKMED